MPRRTATDDESLASFARRRLGRETFERIVQPLVGGIYTADPEKLSLAATMPRFRGNGTPLWQPDPRAPEPAASSRASAADESGARYGLFATLAGGLGSLVARLVDKLPPGSLRLGSAASRIVARRRRANGWSTWPMARRSLPTR